MFGLVIMFLGVVGWLWVYRLGVQYVKSQRGEKR
jgi:hypothetical protein